MIKGSSSRMDWCVRLAAMTAMAIGAFWLAAWWGGFAARWAAAGLITVKTNMALCQVLAGVALMLAGPSPPYPSRRKIAAAAALPVLLTGTLTLSEHLMGWDLGIDQLLASEPPGAAATTAPNRIGPPGSTSLILLGSGLLALALERRAPAFCFGLAACLINLVPAAGYLYGIVEFYGRARITGIAWPTVIALLSLGLGLMLAHRESGPMALLLRADAGGELLRWSLPWAVAFPLALGVLKQYGQNLGLYGEDVGTGLLVVALTVLLLAALWRSAARLSRSAAVRARAEQALRESEEWLRSAFDAADMFSFSWDIPNNAVRREHSRAAVLPPTAPECPGTFEQVVQAVHPEDRAAFEARVRAALRSADGAYQSEYRIVGTDGAVRWLSEQGRVEFDARHQPLRLTGLSHDITERKRLDQEREKFVRLVENSSDFIAMADLNGRITFMNAAGRRMIGLDEAEDPRRLHMTDYAAPASLELVRTVAIPAMREHGLWLGEMQLRNMRTGEIVDVARSAFLVRDASGQPIGFGTVTRDITERKRAEQEIARLNQDLQRRVTDLQTILDTAPIGLAIAEDPEGHHIRGNPASERMLGLPAGSELSKGARRSVPYRVLQDGRELAVEALPMQRAIRGETVAGQAIDVERADGQSIVLYCNAAPLLDEEGQPRGAVGAFLDITEFKQAEAALRRSEARFHLLSDTAGRLLAAKDPQSLINELCREVMAYLDCQVFFNFLADEPAGRLHLNACAGIPEEDVRKFEWLDYGAAVCGRVACDRRPIVAEDIQHASDPGTELVRAYGIQAYCCHPLMAGERLIGTLSFGARTRARFAADEVELMRVVADQVAVAMQRIQVKQALRESELFYRQTLESIPGMVFTTRPDGYRDYQSQQWVEYTGIPMNKHLGDGWNRLLHPDDRPRAFAAWRAAVEERAPYDLEYRVRRRDGEYEWFKVRGRPIRDAEGRIVRWFGVATNIEELKRAETALRERTERYELVLAGAQDAIWDWDVPNRRVLFSPRWKAIRGLADDEIGDHEDEWRKGIHPDDEPRVLAAVRAHLAGETPFFREEYRIRCKDGAWKWILDRGICQRDVDGRVVRMAGSESDITARKQAEEVLRHSEERYRGLVEQAVDGIFVSDAQGHYLDVNSAGAVMLGYTREEILRLSIPDVIAPDEIPRIAPEVAKFADGKVACSEWRFRRKDGSLFSGEIMGRQLPDGRLQAILRDITDRRMRAKLQEQAGRLREADRRKDEFLAMLAHELRNPLAPIRNAVQILKRAGLDETRSAWCRDLIDRQIEQLARLVDDLLDVSRITRGKIELRKEPLDVAVIVQRAVETSRPLIDTHRHALTVHLPPEPLWVEGDLIRLAQVVSNLLNNAAKYTDEGGHIGLAVEPANGDVLLRIRDTGRGIDPVVLPSLFDLFYQVDRNIDRSDGGLGIGLSLVKSLVAMHGGRVQAFSEGPGKGSEFVIRLPRLPGSDRAGETTLPVSAPPVVDDDRDSDERMALLFGTDD
jgi:PAS domain S-box-containing protein